MKEILYLREVYEILTVKQIEAVEALIEHGSERKAAEALGKSKTAINSAVQIAKSKAAKSGYEPVADLVHKTANGFAVTGVSTAYKADGSVGLQWVKQSPDKALALQAMMTAIESYEWRPAPVIKLGSHHDKDLCTLITLTDFHLGMYSWAAECGDDWDVKIAERVAFTAVNQMINDSPDSGVGILNLQGDFLHFDSLKAVTPASGHVLDADSRSSKMIELSMIIMMGCVELMLSKFKAVKVIVCEGNHDEYGSAWLRKAAKQIYRDNPRLEVDDTEFPYYAYKHGRVMLGFHHGHKKKNQQLPQLFAGEPRFRHMWGDTAYTYIHTGHFHHSEAHVSEGGGAIVERHPTLAARDAYAARGGFISKRAAHAITYHTEHGEIKRTTVTPTS
jgi:hypothetical protein